jgi:hypothetical protein
MTTPDLIVESRKALVGFAIAVIAWHEWPTEHGRQQLIEATRVAGAATGVPQVFEDFAQQLERHDHGGSETG